MDDLERYHKNRYNYLPLFVKLWTYLADPNEQAQESMKYIVARMKAAEGITEEMKARAPMAWVGTMNSIRRRA